MLLQTTLIWFNGIETWCFIIYRLNKYHEMINQLLQKQYVFFSQNTA